MFYSKTTHGFYDFTIHNNIPSDAVEIDDTLYLSLMAGQSAGKRIVPGSDGIPTLQDPPPLTTADLVANIAAAVQTHLDKAAKAMGYDDIRSAVTYADEPVVPKFQQEGIALRAWRSLVWQKCYTLLAQVEAGEIEAMTAEQVIAELPNFNGVE